VDLSGSLRNLAQPALGTLLDLAKATQLGGVPGAAARQALPAHGALPRASWQGTAG
jgi:hypothetical protein